MDIHELLFDSSRKTANIAVSIIGEDTLLFKKVFDFALNENGQYAMRAARVVNLSAVRYPELIRPYMNELVHKLPNFRNDGVKRCMAKTFAELPLEFDDDALGILVNTCFDWLLNPQERIALKVYSMEILYNVSQFYPDIKSELASSIESLIPRSSAAIKSKGKSLLKRLQAEMNL